MIDWNTVVVGPTTDIFGEPVRYRTAGIPGAPSVAFAITGIFDEANTFQFENSDFKPGNVLNTKPRLGVQVSQFLPFCDGPSQDDVLTRVSSGRCYQVMAVLEDGHGGALLSLNNVSGTLNPP